MKPFQTPHPEHRGYRILETDPMPSFSYSLNGSTIRTTPVLDQIKVASETGYQALEIWHDKVDEYVESGGTVREIRRALDDSGLAVPTTIYLSGWFDSTGDGHAKAIEECKRRMDQAVELGAEHVISGPPLGTASVDLGAENYYELCEVGRAMGVKPAMEFLGFVEQLNTIEAALEVMEKSGHPAACTILDPFHIFRGGGSVESIAQLTAAQVAISHFNDIPPEPPRVEQHDRHRVLPGEGIFDLQRYVGLLEQIGYSGYLSLELFREDLWNADPHDVAAVGLEKMRAVVKM